MAGWEYEIVTLDWDLARQGATLAAAGRERWELVSVVVSPGEVPIAYLKRWSLEEG